MTQKRVVSASEAARRLGVVLATAVRMAERGDVKAVIYRLPNSRTRCIEIDEDDLDRVVAERQAIIRRAKEVATEC